MRVETYDRRGYASAVGLGPVINLERHVDDLLDVIGAEPAVLVGHSFGGLIAMTAAAETPAMVDAVGVYEAPLLWFDWWQEPYTPGPPDDAAEEFLRRALGSDVWEELPEAFKAARRREGPAFADDFKAASAVAFDFADILSPLAVAHGSRTDERFRRGSETIVAATHASSLSVIEGASHGAHLSHPTEFAQWVRAVAALVAPPLAG